MYEDDDLAWLLNQIARDNDLTDLLDHMRGQDENLDALLDHMRAQDKDLDAPFDQIRARDDDLADLLDHARAQGNLAALLEALEAQDRALGVANRGPIGRRCVTATRGGSVRPTWLRGPVNLVNAVVNLTRPTGPNGRGEVPGSRGSSGTKHYLHMLGP